MGAIPRIWRNQRQRYTLTGQVCRRCGYLSLSPRAVCPQCHPAGVEADLWLPEIEPASEPGSVCCAAANHCMEGRDVCPGARRQAPDKGRIPEQESSPRSREDTIWETRPGRPTR